jgi:hypothetical protein
MAEQQRPQEPDTDRDRAQHRDYESDRRGEHKYPDSNQEDRPSQREHDELKKRLERGR